MTKLIMSNYEENIRFDLDGLTLEESVKVLMYKIEMYGPSATLDITGDNVCIDVFSKREETDSEYLKRVNDENNCEKVRTKIERKEYERLKAKFEG